MLCTKMQWIFSFLTVIVVVNTTVESSTQAGSPIFFNYPSGKPQIPHGFGESQGICVIPIPDQQRAENDVSNSGELQPNPSDAPTEIQIWTVIMSLKESFELFLQYLRYKLNVFVRNHDVGSLLITVECSSLEILEGLWEDYRSGHLNAIAQEILVTAEVLEKLGLDEVRLKTFISEEEYENGKLIFKDISGEWHVLSVLLQLCVCRSPFMFLKSALFRVFMRFPNYLVLPSCFFFLFSSLYIYLVLI